MVDGVIFDMDGLMFDTERIWVTLWEPALAVYGLPYKQGLAEAARGTTGEATYKVLRGFYGEACDAPGIWRTINELAEQEFLRAPVPKKAGLDELLAWLGARGVPLAVASSSPESTILHHLDSWNLRQYFTAVISGTNVTRPKPDPETFLVAARALGVAPARCMVLEDSYNGVRAASAGGFVTVMVPDLSPANDEMRSLYTMECESLLVVKEKLENGEI